MIRTIDLFLASSNISLKSAAAIPAASLISTFIPCIKALLAPFSLIPASLTFVYVRELALALIAARSSSSETVVSSIVTAALVAKPRVVAFWLIFAAVSVTLGTTRVAETAVAFVFNDEIASILGESEIVTVTPFLNKTALLVSSGEAISETFLKLIEEAPFVVMILE